VSQPKQQLVLVAGGGIGGLAAALACARAGLPVQLFERSPALAEVGAGIQLGPNVTRLLQAWGLTASLQAVAAYPENLVIRGVDTGAELGRLRLGAQTRARYGAPYATIHRADLQALLLQAVQAEAGVALTLDQAITGFEQDATGVSVQHADGHQTPGALLVGADGLWSRVRQHLLGDGAPRLTGHQAYRALLPQAELPAALRCQDVVVWLGTGLHLVQYPVRGGDWLNVVALVEDRTQHQNPGDRSGWDHAALGADLQQLLHGAAPALQALVQAMGGWRLWHLQLRDTVASASQMAQGRVALLGDAAHPMLPYLAQGAGMAIEDAQALGQALAASGATPAALTQYAQARWQRNARVQKRALRNAWIFHTSGPTRWGRDLAMRLLGDRLLDLPWLYGGP
jgi:salicylate hydroxylase